MSLSPSWSESMSSNDGGYASSTSESVASKGLTSGSFRIANCAWRIAFPELHGCPSLKQWIASSFEPSKKNFLQASEENRLIVQATGKRKREVGLVVPAKFTAFTKELRIARILQKELLTVELLNTIILNLKILFFMKINYQCCLRASISGFLAIRNPRLSAPLRWEALIRGRRLLLFQYPKGALIRGRRL